MPEAKAWRPPHESRRADRDPRRCGWARSGATKAVDFASELRVELQLTRAL